MADKEKDTKDTKSTDPVQMEVGGTGTVQVMFKDALGNDVPPTNVQWSSTGNVVVTPDAEDPTKATLLAVGAGPSTVRAQGSGENGGFAEAVTQVVALEKDVASTGELTVAVQPAPAKKKVEEKPAEKKPEQHQAHATTQHH